MTSKSGALQINATNPQVADAPTVDPFVLGASIDAPLTPCAVVQRSSTPEIRAGSNLVGNLSSRQIEIATARAALLDECQRMANDSNITTAQAEIGFVEQAKIGTLPPTLGQLVLVANAMSGTNGRTITTRTLAAWRGLARGAATPTDRIARLAPMPRKRWDLPQDVAQVLALYRTPNKPALSWCVQQVAGKSGPAFTSLYERCRRFRKNLPA
ncbi:MAG: hypothetical protein ACREXU_18875, partial [Gammaproteobacteria bacterium]